MTREQQDIVMVTVDSLRADHCGFLNSQFDITPTLDRLSENSLVFENAIAPGPRTPSSMPSAMTGEMLPKPEYEDWTFGYRRNRIAEHLSRHRTIANRLSAAGYETVGMTINPWTQGTSFDDGFDRFIHLSDVLDSDSQYASTPAGFKTLERIMAIRDLSERFNWDSMREWFASWPQYFETIQEEINQSSQPTFLWLFVLDTHQPYITPVEFRENNSATEMYYAVFRGFRNTSEDDLPPYVRNMLHRAYKDSIRSVDALVEQMIDYLDDNSVFVFHSDHGEAFGDHTHIGHQSVLYEENIHVPLLLKNVDHSGAIEAPISLKKLPAMLEEIGNISCEFDPQNHTQNTVFATTEDQMKSALRGKDWKYIYDLDSDHDQLYDLDKDPKESKNLLKESDEMIPELRSLLKQHEENQIEREHIIDAAINHR
jgi:arylsulfatase